MPVIGARREAIDRVFEGEQFQDDDDSSPSRVATSWDQRSGVSEPMSQPMGRISERGVTKWRTSATTREKGTSSRTGGPCPNRRFEWRVSSDEPENQGSLLCGSADNSSVA
jgi:hypothetical protein